jgi:hypothetical protein
MLPEPLSSRTRQSPEWSVLVATSIQLTIFRRSRSRYILSSSSVDTVLMRSDDDSLYALARNRCNDRTLSVTMLKYRFSDW